jgi:uncharacterized protein YaiI (UPF0178 family)
VTTVYIDGDACPVKFEIYKAAGKRGLRVVLVANVRVGAPHNVEVVVVDSGSDAADDWIAEQCRENDVVVTADIPLASRALKAKAFAIGHKGRLFTEDNIGEALGMRDLMKHIRQVTGKELGPKPFSPKDRREFMREFSQLLENVARK